MSTDTGLPARSAGPNRVVSTRLRTPRPLGLGPPSFRQILVVDDDPSLRDLIAKTVTQAGFRVDVARDGEEGWNALCRADYALVITDNEMPKLTGIKLIERIRSVSVEPPCILISGNMAGLETQLAGRPAPEALLGKPFSAAALIERIFTLLLRGETAAY